MWFDKKTSLYFSQKNYYICKQQNNLYIRTMSTEKTKEKDIEDKLIQKLSDLKYNYRPDIVDRNTLEKNFRDKFQELNRCNLTDTEFKRLKEEIRTTRCV